MLDIVVVYSLSCVQLFGDPWTVAQPGSSVHGIFQGRILEGVAMYIFVLIVIFVVLNKRRAGVPTK